MIANKLNNGKIKTCLFSKQKLSSLHTLSSNWDNYKHKIILVYIDITIGYNWHIIVLRNNALNMEYQNKLNNCWIMEIIFSIYVATNTSTIECVLFERHGLDQSVSYDQRVCFFNLFCFKHCSSFINSFQFKFVWCNS